MAKKPTASHVTYSEHVARMAAGRAEDGKGDDGAGGIGQPANGVTGVRATGTVTTDDYERVFNPLMAAAHREGRRVRLLYEVPAEFKGFTAGAGLEDMRMGMKYLRLFERCAVVTDVGWLREATRLFGAMMPCPVKVFPNAERAQAIDWMAAPVLSTVQHRLLPDIGVLVIEPSQPLGAEDFDAIAATVDPWIEGFFL